jgi:hypothetical protein
MKLYKIDKNIKLPPVAISRKPSTPSVVALTIDALNKGDSFLIRDPLDGLKAEKRMRDFNARERERKGERLFVSRKVPLGVRIWRTQ